MSLFKLGISLSLVSKIAAMCITVGKVSFEDYDLLTWSFGCTNDYKPSCPPRISVARFDITSFEFMFDYVPEPVYQTTRGKWESSFPCLTSSAASIIASAILWSRPNYLLAFAAAFFKAPNALITGIGILSRSPPILKFISDLWVYAPQYLSAGTSNGPKVSFSVLVPTGLAYPES